MKKLFLSLATVLLLGPLRPAMAENITATILEWTAQPVYEDASPSADTIFDGNVGTITITLPATMTNLIGAAASATINVQDYFLRINFVAPTTGGLNVSAYLNGKK